MSTLNIRFVNTTGGCAVSTVLKFKGGGLGTVLLSSLSCTPKSFPVYQPHQSLIALSPITHHLLLEDTDLITQAKNYPSYSYPWCTGYHTQTVNQLRSKYPDWIEELTVHHQDKKTTLFSDLWRLTMVLNCTCTSNLLPSAQLSPLIPSSYNRRFSYQELHRLGNHSKSPIALSCPDNGGHKVYSITNGNEH